MRETPRPTPEFVSSLRRVLVGAFGLTGREQRAVLIVLALLLLGCIVRYGRFLGVSA